MHVARSKDHSDAAGYSRLREVSGDLLVVLAFGEIVFVFQLNAWSKQAANHGCQRITDAVFYWMLHRPCS